MIFKTLRRTFLIRQTMLQPSIVEIEKEEYKKLVVEYRNKNREIFSEQMGNVENDFISMLIRQFQ